MYWLNYMQVIRRVLRLHV